MNLTGVIPEPLHCCPGCFDGLASGLDSQNLPRRCGRCEGDVAPVKIVYIDGTPFRFIPLYPELQAAPEGLKASGVLLGVFGSVVLVALGYGLASLVWRLVS